MEEFALLDLPPLSDLEGRDCWLGAGTTTTILLMYYSTLKVLYLYLWAMPRWGM